MTLALTPDARTQLTSMLAQDEGFRQYPYRDSRGILTIGYGRNLEAVGISKDEALSLMINDIQKAEHELWNHFPSYEKLSDVRKCVLIDMAFNLGFEGLMGFRGMIACIGNDDFAGAAEHMRNSLWDTQVKARAERLAYMMETNTFWEPK